jgi:hypothetical protein
MDPLMIAAIAVGIDLILLYTAIGLYLKTTREAKERKYKFAQMFNKANPIK